MASIYKGLDSLRARTVDGHDNDGDGISTNDIGERGDAFVRITPARYVTNNSDGSLGAPFGGPPGPNGMVLPVAPSNPPPIPVPQPGLVGTLPQARAVSDAVMSLAPNDQNRPSSFAVNEIFDFFGQILTHDMAEAATAPSGDIPLLMDGLPFPFARTPYELDEHGVRQQHNEETSFLDLSMVYGNTQARLDLARDTLPGGGESAKLLLGANGLLPTIKEVGIDSGLTSLQVLQTFTEVGFGGLPNLLNNPNPDPATFENRFYAGDNRVNQQGPLISLQTIWAREHNYQVDQLTPTAAAQGWTQDQLFEAARAINEAEWQHVVYDEYLPALIGGQADVLLAAYRATHPDLPAGIINEWTTVAFRFGHDQSSNDYTLLNADGSTYLQISLGAAFGLAAQAQNVPGAGHSAADIDAWIRGLSSQFAQELDGFVADGNRDALFGIPGTTVDLNAFDIQRGRDHGVWSYNSLRDGLGLSTYASFDAYAAANGYAPGDARIAALKSVYGNDINKLDSLVGGMLERRYAGSQLGETFTLLTALQFAVLKEGDAFYYENRLADNPELLATIEGTTFAEIMMRNSGADHMHLDAFHVANKMAFGAGNDVKFGADLASVLKADLMIGAAGNDTLFGREGSDTLYGDAGSDTLNGGNGNDYLRGGADNDILIGGAGSDNAAGEHGNDLINLDAGDDRASGGDGNDIINGGDGADTILGNAGNDILNGGRGNDTLFGGDGVDIVNGDAGADTIYGGDGADTLSGGTGGDVLSGDGGNDILVGGANNDIFVFDADFGSDRIQDFDANPVGGQDYIDLTAFGITQATFAARVAITDVGFDTLVTIDGQIDQVVRLAGVTNAATVTFDDFLLA
jgi:Ca2+-binding RTX toxin-like protein